MGLHGGLAPILELAEARLPDREGAWLWMSHSAIVCGRIPGGGSIDCGSGSSSVCLWGALSGSQEVADKGRCRGITAVPVCEGGIRSI